MPNHPITPAQIDHDHLKIDLVEPDSMPAMVRIVWPQAPTVATPANYPAVAAAITRIIAESATALARWKAHGR